MMNAEEASKDAQSHAGAKVEGRMKNAEGLCKAISSHPHAVTQRIVSWGRRETAANSFVEIGPWTRKDSANLKWLSIADLGGCGRLFAVFGGTGGIASRTAPEATRGHPQPGNAEG